MFLFPRQDQLKFVRGMCAAVRLIISRRLAMSQISEIPDEGSLLQAYRGRRESPEELSTLVFDELRQVARACMRREPSMANTLSASLRHQTAKPAVNTRNALACQSMRWSASVWRSALGCLSSAPLNVEGLANSPISHTYRQTLFIGSSRMLSFRCDRALTRER
jgi:hypothetical protein